MAIQLPLLNLHSQSSTPGIKMRIPVLPLLLAFLCLVPCSWSQALQNTPIVVSAITPAPTGDAELYYNPITGELIIATNGVAAVAITGQSDNPFDLSTVTPNGAGPFFVPGFGSFRPFDAETFIDNQLVAFAFDATDPGTVSLPTGVHILGPILAPGAFTPADFTAAFGDIRLDRIVTGQPIIEPSGVVRIINAPPVEIDVAVNGGEAPRTILREIQVTFPSDVQIGAGAFSIVNRDDNSVVPTVSFEEEPGTSPTVATLTFSGDGVDIASGSLADGNYELTINGDLITNAQGIALDADSDGTPGGLLVFGDQETDDFYRLFGDVNGDRIVDGIDFSLFVPTFFIGAGNPSFNPSFDFDISGLVDGIDFAQFVDNFFQPLSFE